MGVSTSASALIVFFAVLAAVGTLYVATSNTAERVGDAVDAQQEDARALQRTAIEITGTSYADGETTVTVANTGETTLSVAETDILVDGRYQPPETYTNATVEGRETDTWAPGERLTIVVPTAPPERVKVVTASGVARVAEPSLLTDGDGVVFTDGDALRSIETGGTATDYGSGATVTGPMVEGFLTADTDEIPFVDAGGDVAVVNGTGTVTTLSSGARSTASRLFVGRFDSPPAVFYVAAGSGEIRRVTADGTDTRVASVAAQGVAGTGDVDGDGAAELVFGGTSPGGSSATVNYVDDDGAVVGTGVGYGTNEGIGIGEPRDFDGDGLARVPIVDGSGNVALVAGDGATTTITASGPAGKGPLAAFDWDTDGDREIVFTNTSATLAYVDAGQRTDTPTTIADANGDPVAADADTGAA
jgi:flagellar protein FlaF